MHTDQILARVDRGASFINFVYPFLFNPEAFIARCHVVDAAQWRGRDDTLAVWEPEQFPEEDLLAHVAHYLNPPDGAIATARLWRMTAKALQSTAGLGSGAQWFLLCPHCESGVPFEIEAASFIMFHIGVGFLTLRIKPLSEEVPYWLNFLHYFRFVKGQRRVRLRAQRATGRDEVRPFFAGAAGGLTQHPEGMGTCADLLEALLSTAALEGESIWWREVFVPGQLIPFSALYVDGLDEAEVPLLIYRVRNFFHARQGEMPSHYDLHPDYPVLLPYAERQWFTFSLEGGAFVACDAPRTAFFRETMPSHLQDQYFLLFILALHQRFALMMLSMEVAQHGLIENTSVTSGQSAEAFERIRARLLSFTARGYFSQVMQRAHHHRCYCRWQELFLLDRLFQEVSEEIQEMHNYLLMKRTEQLERLAEQQQQRLNILNWIVGLIAVPALTLTFAQVAKDLGWETAISWSIVGLGAGILLIGAIYLFQAIVRK